jgi:hypothetical protein
MTDLTKNVIPVGGSAGQVLAKNSGTDYDNHWITPASPPVSSVSNSDGTLTISPTTGAVVASLALGHANTWTGKQTFNTAAPNVGTATASTIAGFDGSKDLTSLSTSTYPSLTELAYVKGVTSAIQTQLDGKQASITTNTGWTVSNVTTDKVMDANATSIDELADVLGTLITALKAQGILGT